ncbi:hypothetical protein [Mucilaginibacter myungsuensis]|uniref:Uncharacterized protein n=1 Tax=Mucilaginibacter myungsuensis TaxID=649104 RepID=A0A929KSW2_9SPHI|nr:hypothetical protein [Mucilaginibacter myungsuensis]MBE9660926.1 hypothetical protein [Mucilaginibacter myungsuensis]MDN3600972.1 hypothetical protein [Mucilaginibacter myungsuensis]
MNKLHPFNQIIRYTKRPEDPNTERTEIRERTVDFIFDKIEELISQYQH